jgi:hypothetical protein
MTGLPRIRDRGAPDVIDGGRVSDEGGADPGRLGRIPLRPGVIDIDEQHSLTKRILTVSQPLQHVAYTV